MAEPYSDEALAAIQADPNHVHDQLRLWPTIERLRAERDEVARKLSDLTRPVEPLGHRPQSAVGRAWEQLIAERDEARRVARVLYYASFGVELTPAERQRVQADADALKARHGNKLPFGGANG